MSASISRDTVQLVIGSAAYVGWTALAIDIGIDSLCGGFDLELTSRERTGAPAFPIAAGMACSVVLGGTPLVTGWIDRVGRALDPESRTISVAGRDKACDLVDCSAMNSPGSWRNATLQTIAAELARPFGVTLTITGDAGKPFARFAIQPGETAFAAIERLCRYRGLIAWSDGRGGVTIGNPDSGQRIGRITEGRNLKALSSEEDASGRFSSYLVKGQASGDDRRNGKTVAQVKGAAEDPAITRYRPLLVIGEEQSDAASLERRAKWEAQTRAGRAERHTAIVQGWFADEGLTAGPVWRAGARTRLEAPSHGIARDLLIERVRLSLDEGGTQSELTLVPPEAWAQLPEAEARS